MSDQDETSTAAILEDSTPSVTSDDELVTLVWDFESQNADELSAKAGAMLRVLPNPFPESDWLLVCDPQTRQTGLVPTSYVSATEPAAPEIAAESQLAGPVEHDDDLRRPDQRAAECNISMRRDESVNASLAELVRSFESETSRIRQFHTCETVRALVLQEQQQQDQLQKELQQQEQQRNEQRQIEQQQHEQQHQPPPPERFTAPAVPHHSVSTEQSQPASSPTSGLNVASDASDVGGDIGVPHSSNQDLPDYRGNQHTVPRKSVSHVVARQRFVTPSSKPAQSDINPNSQERRHGKARQSAESVSRMNRTTSLINTAVSKDHARQYGEAYESYAAALDELVLAMESGDNIANEDALLARMAGYLRRMCMLEPGICGTVATFKPYSNRVRILRLLVRRGKFDAIGLGEEYRTNALELEATAAKSGGRLQDLQALSLAYTVALDSFMAVYEEEREKAGRGGARSTKDALPALQKVIMPMLTRAEELKVMLSEAV